MIPNLVLQVLVDPGNSSELGQVRNRVVVLLAHTFLSFLTG